MIIFISSLEVLLLLLVVLVGYRVFKGYQSEHVVAECSNKNKVTSEIKALNSEKEKLTGKSVVEAYIDDFFVVDRVHLSHSVELVIKPKPENKDRSISSKVIDAMMAEADMACVS